MEFRKREIRNYTWKAKNTMQFTIDDTINVPESLLDMERLILVKGNVVIEETQAMVDRFQIKGSLNYQILYIADKEGNAFDSLNGKVPFVEYVNADGTNEKDYIEVHSSLSDLTVTMLHSRKISLKALVGIDYQVKENENFEAVEGIDEDSSIEVLSGTLSMISLKLQKKEKQQIAEQVEIPSNKPNIYQVIWKSVAVTNTQIKPGDGYLMAGGNLSVFLIYRAEEEDMPIQFFTMDIPFEQRIEEDISSEDMISGSFLSLDQYHITVVSDESGEDRLLDIVADFTVEIKLYGNEEMNLVRDAYSPEMEIDPEWKNFTVQRLLLRNCARTKISETETMPKSQSILQICYVEGSVSIEDTERTAKGILVEGVLGTQITYMNKEENGVLSSVTFDIPFSQEIEIAGMKEDVTYSIIPFLDQITAMQLNDNQLEIKADVSLEVLAFANEPARAVLDMKVQPINQQRKKNLPCVVGYVVKKNDTLWSIAKNYYTTVDRIRQINELDSDQVAVGDKLVILKE